MSIVNKSRLEIKLGTYLVGQATALTDPLWQTRAQDYRRLLASRMIPIEGTEIKKRLPAAKYHVSLKVDGEFNILVYDEGEVFTINPGGTVRVGLPIHAEAAELIKKAGLKKAIFAGEFYYERSDKKRSRIHDIVRIARQPSSQAELNGIRFAVFDAIEIDGKPWPGFTDVEWKQITTWFGRGKIVHPVEAHWASDSVAVDKLYQGWVNDGAEGAVIRSEQAGQFKIKPRHTLDVVVIGFTEGTEDRKGMIHDLLLAMMRPDGCLHIVGRTGGGFTEEDRRGFLSDFKDMIVASDYTEVNDQVAYHMVRPEWAVEISVLDVISETTRGATINKMVIHWNKDKNKYETVRRMPLANLISPQFVRRREDKSVNTQDIRTQQVADIVEIDMLDRDARTQSHNKSTILKREVYTKILKGATMVRKFLMWQTNKEQENEDFPAYVIHFTDFSPNRKTPLERDARVSSSKEQIEELWKELVAENLAKGWEKYDQAGTAVAPAPAAPAAAPKKRATKKKADDAL